MRRLRRLRFLCAFLGLTLLASYPAQAQAPAEKKSAPKPDKKDLREARSLSEKALAAERAGDWQSAFEYSAQAASVLPDHAEYALQRERARARLVQQHIERAEAHALVGRLAEARAELYAAVQLDPEYALPRERLEQLQPRARLEVASPQDQERPPQLRPAPGKRSFNIRGNTRAAYERVAVEFGLWATFDPELRDRTVRLRLDDVDYETALNVLGQQTGTFWRAVDARTILVAQSTAQKWREYAPTVTRSILLPGSASPEQMAEAVRIVRDVVGITRVQLDTRSRTLTLRDTPESVDLALALLTDLEQPLGEVFLDITILEVDRQRARQLGITPPSSAQAFSVTPEDIRAAQQATTLQELLAILQRILSRLPGFSGFSAEQLAILLAGGQTSLIPPLLAFGGGRTVFFSTLPGAAAEFAETLSLVRRGRRVFLRAQDGEAATFFVGERVPLQLSRLESPLRIPGLDTTSTIRNQFPLFQFEELGLKIKVTPRLHTGGDVTLQLSLDIRALLAQSVNDIPVITNQTVEQSVRLRENETTVLAGIVREDTQFALSGWPALGRVPVAGHLASRRDRQRGESELLILVTPRIVRLAPRMSRVFYAGREPVSAGAAPQQPGQQPGAEPQRPEQPQPQPPTQPQTPPPTQPRPPPRPPQ